MSEDWFCDFVDDCPEGTDESSCDGNSGYNHSVNGSGGSDQGVVNDVIIVYPDEPTSPPINKDCGGMICDYESGTCVPRGSICDGVFDCKGNFYTVLMIHILCAYF